MGRGAGGAQKGMRGRNILRVHKGQLVSCFNHFFLGLTLTLSSQVALWPILPFRTKVTSPHFVTWFLDLVMVTWTCALPAASTTFITELEVKVYWAYGFEVSQMKFIFKV